MSLERRFRSLSRRAPTRFGGILSAAAIVGLLGACATNYRLDKSSIDADDGARSVLNLRWHKRLVDHGPLDFRPQEWSSAAFGPAGTIFIGTSKGRFHAFNAAGKQLWSVDTHGAISCPPLFLPRTQTVYFGADDGKLYAVDALTGKTRWTYSTKGVIAHAPAISQGVLVFTTNENRVYALDAATGRWRWQYEREHPDGFTIHGFAGPTAHGSVIYTGFSDGYVVALQTSTGDVVWTHSLAGDKPRFVDADTTPVVHQGRLLVAGYSTGLHSLDLDSGKAGWRFPLQGITAVTGSRGGIFVAAPKVGLVALDNQGRERWKQSVPKGVPARPLVVGPYVFLTGTESGLAVADGKDGQLLQYFGPGYGISAPPTVSGRTLAVLSNLGHLYIFDLL